MGLFGGQVQSSGQQYVPWKNTSGTTSPCVCAKPLQLYPTLCDPVDCSPPDSSLHGILQARKLECVAMPSSRGSSWLRDRICVSFICLHWQAGSLPQAPPGKPTPSPYLGLVGWYGKMSHSQFRPVKQIKITYLTHESTQYSKCSQMSRTSVIIFMLLLFSC